MAENQTGYGGWEWLDMDESEQKDVFRLKRIFNITMEAHGYTPETCQSVEVDVKKARLSISPEERRTGAYHSLEGEEPFYRLTFKAPGFIGDGSQGIKVILMLIQAYANLGGGFLNDARDQVELHHDFKGAIGDKARELHMIVKAITPYIIKPKPSGGAPSPA